MKKYIYPLALVLVVAIGCNNPQDNSSSGNGGGGPVKDTTVLRFSCLKYSMASLADSLAVKPLNYYNDFVFNFYYKGINEPFRVIAYGHAEPPGKPGTYDPLTPTPFSIVDSAAASFTSTECALGNLSIKGDTLTQVIDYGKTKNADSIMLIPVIDQYQVYKHISYHLYLTSGHNSVISLKGIDGITTDYVDLNPCPPAHMDTQQ